MLTFESIGYQLGQRLVEHAKNDLQNIMIERTHNIVLEECQNQSKPNPNVRPDADE